MENLRIEISKILKEELTMEEVPVAQPTPEAPLAQAVAPIQKDPKMVRFNGGTEAEYQVLFSERGFMMDDTRMSFEEIHNALSKEYIITLKGGTVLDAVKMQQILKYKEMF